MTDKKIIHYIPPLPPKREKRVSIYCCVSTNSAEQLKSLTTKGKWCKRTIDVMLSNEKYTGNVRLLDGGKHDSHYLAEENNPAIISKETFQAVQIEKQHRSNVTKAEDGNQRKSKKYSL